MDQYTPLGEIQSSAQPSTQTVEYENTLRRLKESPLHSLRSVEPTPFGFSDSPFSIDETNGVPK